MIKKIYFLFILVLAVFVCGCAGMAASAQEYYSIGMAYFELGKYEEAEKWLSRAAQTDRTMVASQYNLGRLAFERQRYDEAARRFESILRRDPDNVLALKAAAYARIMTGDIPIAEKHYSRLLELVPESADDGYNHALVLYAMGRFGAAEEVLERYPFSLQENRDSLLLYARSLAAQNKVEAIDNFSTWLSAGSDYKVRYEYAQALEKHGLFARAIEEYRLSLSEASAAAVNPNRAEIRFALGRALLIADTESAGGITEIQAAVNEGFNDIAAVEALQRNTRVSTANRNRLRETVNNMQRAIEAGRALETNP